MNTSRNKDLIFQIRKMEFNKIVKETLERNGSSVVNLDIAFEEASAILPKKIANKNKPWISEETLKQVEIKYEMEQKNDGRLRDQIKLIRRCKRKDRKIFTHNMVDKDMDIKDKWIGIKYLKQTYKPNMYEKSDKQGKKVSLKEKAEATADYLEQVQWKNGPQNEQSQQEPNNQQNFRPPVDEVTNEPIKRNMLEADFNCDDFSMQDLRWFIKKAKNRKACGPDDIPTEFFMFLDEGNLTNVLIMINEWWTCGTFPIDKLEAEVVSLYKKGDPLNPANYRPISLLCSIYKIYAGLIQKRLSEAMDADISDLQFAFRKKEIDCTTNYLHQKNFRCGGSNQKTSLFDIFGLGKSV